MKNFDIIYPDEMDDFFSSFWRTEEFKNMQKFNPYFKVWVNKLKEAPIFFFDISHEKGKYHLTSHMRLIARREYDDDYMHDLYYMHELTHCAEFEASTSNDYSLWMNKLNDNELYASIVSEVLVYYFSPSMIGKTFNPLWANRFYNKDKNNINLTIDKFGFFIEKDEENFEEKPIFTLMNFDNASSWPKSIQEIISRRKELRNITNNENLREDEVTIIQYNLPRYKWIEKWERHYRKIDDLLIGLKNKSISTDAYLDAMYDNCDEFYRPFFPK